MALYRDQEKHDPRRRRLLWGLAGTAACLSFAPVGRALASVSPASPRSLSLLHTHTAESLKVGYFDGTTYCPDALSTLDNFLRDFRTGEATQMDRRLFDGLHALRALADRDATFEVISAYRSPATNQMLAGRSAGVARRSLHMQGNAIDVRLTGFSTRKLFEHARQLGLGGAGLYLKSDFIHLDTGRVRFWTG
jgi:uncharacterized protein YcbK (DUF882 family)